MITDDRENIVDNPHPWIQAYFHGTRAQRFGQAIDNSGSVMHGA
jgi:hypothetical protein